METSSCPKTPPPTAPAPPTPRTRPSRPRPWSHWPTPIAKASLTKAENGCFGRDSIRVGGAGTGEAHRHWSMRQERLTPQYTTQWSDLPVALA
ncbi:MAG: DUF4113 domain-containing protein [Candidatus Competibacteraceae bacterium]|nr:DUF4113 domain-containing protein [Candidatus Competibacteraceae bacterium]